jgi:phage replication O-like protein O
MSNFEREINTASTAQIINFERPVVKADLAKGYDRIAHDITNALARNVARLSGCEFQVVFAIVQKTYRFHKKVDWISNSQICDMTDMSKAHVSKTVKSLVKKNVFIKTPKKNSKLVGINNVVSEWGVEKVVEKVVQSDNNENNEKLSNQLPIVVQSVSLVVQSDNNSCPIRPPHKKKETITKETNTKETIYNAHSTLPKKGIFSPNQSSKIPEHFLITDEMKSWALEEKITVDLETETIQFVDHFLSKGEARESWLPAWRFWMRNSKKFNSGKNQSQSNQRQAMADSTRAIQDWRPGNV